MLTGSQASFHLLHSLPSHLPAAGFSRLLAPSQRNAEIYQESLALAETLKRMINTHTCTISLKHALEVGHRRNKQKPQSLNFDLKITVLYWKVTLAQEDPCGNLEVVISELL